jgi:hydrogenase maturation protein HypF
VASLLDCGDRSGFEGEAAIALEALAASAPHSETAREDASEGVVPGDEDAIACADLVREVAIGVADGAARAALARRFHDALSARLSARAAAAARAHGAGAVVLSGGCLQNRLLVEALSRDLAQRGLEPLAHRRIPPNDGNLAVGQAWYGLRWLCRMRR